VPCQLIRFRRWDCFPLAPQVFLSELPGTSATSLQQSTKTHIVSITLIPVIIAHIGIVWWWRGSQVHGKRQQEPVTIAIQNILSHSSSIMSI
jgi:hypothetical protein